MRRRRFVSGLGLVPACSSGRWPRAHRLGRRPPGQEAGHDTTTLSPREAGSRSCGSSWGGVHPGGQPPHRDRRHREPPQRPRRRRYDLTKQTTAAQRRLDTASARSRRRGRPGHRRPSPGGRAGPGRRSRQEMNQTVAAMYQRGTSEEQASTWPWWKAPPRPDLSRPSATWRAPSRATAGTSTTSWPQGGRRPVAPPGRRPGRGDPGHPRPAGRRTGPADRPQGPGAGQPGGGQVGGGRQQTCSSRSGPEGRLPVGAQRPPGRIGRRRRVPPPGPGRPEAASRRKRTFKARCRPDQQRLRHPGASHPGRRAHAHRGRLRRRDGLPIKAAGRHGRLGRARGGYGNAVIIDHRNGWPPSTPTSPG